MFKRFLSSAERIRNIGIIAHIDAGKTTTTERMLYYVGYTQRIGNVDDGSTVTDYLKTERERGITITSACIPLGYRDHRINLIDTPGHVDFTIEVERSLMVLDGAVTVLDGVAGVEAQTETVWKQSNRYNIPRVCFVNKMDRQGASFVNTIASMRRLTGWGSPIPIQLPLFKAQTLTTKDNSGGQLVGVIDLVSMQHLDFSEHPTGRIVKRAPIPEIVLEQAQKARADMIEQLAELDDTILEHFLESGDAASIPMDLIQKALRKTTIEGSAVPVLCGAAFRNLGVQPVLDAICDYLPHPNERPLPALKNDKKPQKSLFGLAFKVIYDHQRGPIVFVRVYEGQLQARSMVKVAKRGKQKERATKVIELYADDMEEIPAIEKGNIGAIIGTKNICTGDVIVSHSDTNEYELAQLTIPPPVFVRSCEGNEKELEQALHYLLLEDPSLHVHYNEETGQTLISGMGELHLEIAGERLKETYKVHCKLGKVEISYRETIASGSNQDMDFDRTLLNKRLQTKILMSVEPKEGENAFEIDQITVGGNPIAQQKQFAPVEEYEQAIEEAIKGGLSHGPLLGFPVRGVNVRVSVDLQTPETSTPQAVRAGVQNCLLQMIKKDPMLQEPIMNLNVMVPHQFVGTVTKDMNGQRRGQVLEIGELEDRALIHCRAPLAELVGYASVLRGMTQGTGEWTMTLDSYEPVPSHRQEQVIQSVRGY
ncbi:P-loop containing nucleoside triphosphate hydrolase protein [Gorgonomyces haynaldii]|nr:P-loop containing nucleoside triphosphate hydrolase protein [Gorgonomyces haynaldii]